MMCPTFLFVILGEMRISVIPKNQESLKKPYKSSNYLLASSIATATATVIPTMGLLPAPMATYPSHFKTGHFLKSEQEPVACLSLPLKPPRGIAHLPLSIGLDTVTL